MKNRLRKYYEEPPGDTVVIHTGLSVVACGYIIDLCRNEESRVARVRVRLLAGHIVTGLEQPGVQSAADMLTARARRFLGHGWRVIEWIPRDAAPAAGA